MSVATGNPGLFTDRRRLRVAVGLGVLLLVAFFPTLVELSKVWIEWPEYGHGLLMPPVAAWLVWDRRERLRALRPGDGALGAGIVALTGVLMFAAVGLLILGEMKLSWFLKPYAFVAATAGLVTIVWGWRGLRALVAPLVVLFLMCPLPFRLHTALMLPLKKHAAVLATGLLQLTGVPASLEGNLILVPGIQDMAVADACSGIRSLLSLTSVAILACILWKRHWALKAVIVVSCVPIALFVNALRIWLSTYLAVHVSPDAAQGFSHLAEGFLLFGVAAALLWGWAMLLSALLGHPGADEAQKVATTAVARPMRRGLHRFAAAAAAIALAIGVYYVYTVRARLDAGPPSAAAIAQLQGKLRSLPLRAGAYRGESIEWNGEIVEKSGADAYGAYFYRSPGAARGIQVYLGGALRSAENLHTPNVCMPASGWEATDHRAQHLAALGAPAQRLVMQKNHERKLVYYWFQSGDRLGANEWVVRWRRLLDLFANRPLSPTVVVCVYVDIESDEQAAATAAERLLTSLGPPMRAALTPGVLDG